METSKPVIVGVDGSESSLDALREAGQMAELMDAPLKVVAAWRWPVLADGEQIDFPELNPQRDAQKMLNGSLHTVFGESLPPWVEPEVHEGRAARVLRDLSNDARMLVVGSRGHGGFAGLLLGSVSSAVAAHATCPVLITHRTAA
jgi:nucleotide-binding universal stress UspA family protein